MFEMHDMLFEKMSGWQEECREQLCAHAILTDEAF